MFARMLALLLLERIMVLSHEFNMPEQNVGDAGD